MKKIVLMSILLMITFILIPFTSAAYSEFDYQVIESVSDEFNSWEIENKRIVEVETNILKSNRYFFTADKVDELIIMPINYTSFSGNIIYSESMIIESKLAFFSTVEVFNQIDDVRPSEAYRFDEIEPGVFTNSDFEDAVKNGEVQNKYIRLSFVLDGLDENTSSSYDQFLSSFLGDVNYGDSWSDVSSFSLRWTIDPFDVTDFDDVNDLPSTSGDISTAGEVGAVRYQMQGNNVHFIIHYAGLDYHILKAFEDVSVFEMQNQAYYYKDLETGDHIIYFDYGSTDIPFLFDSSLNVDYSPFTLFNLDTNDYNYTGIVDVYSMIQTEHDDEVYLYFYLDDIEYDYIQALDIGFEYYYEKDGGWFSDDKVSETFETYVSLQKGEESTVTQIPTWVEKAYFGSIAATAVGGVLTAFPATSVVGWSIMGVGVAGLLGTTAVDYLKVYELSIEDIAEYIPTSEQKAYLESIYQLTSDDPDFTLPETAQLYKLFLGEYDLGEYDRIQTISNTLDIATVTYSVNNQLITIDAEWLRQHDGGDDTFDPIPYDKPDDNFKIEIPDWVKNPVTWILVGLGFFSIIGFGLILSNGGNQHVGKYK